MKRNVPAVISPWRAPCNHMRTWWQQCFFYAYLTTRSMKILFSPAIFLFFLAITLHPSHPAVANEFSGAVKTEGRAFFNEPLFQDQQHHNASLAFAPEYYHQLKNGSSMTIAPFFRTDSADSERSHFDLREMNFLWLTDSFELKVGISKVFWGAAEFVHLVDIINQTDLVEAIDYEEKLGQPMVHLSVPRDWGVVSLFVLPWFRERTFVGRKGRLRPELEIDVDNAQYESDAKDHHVDLAARYSHTLGGADFGLYHFVGTGREPTLVPSLDNLGRPVLVPYYEQIQQTGLDLQLAAGSWLWKFEAIYRTGQGEDFFSGIGGLEYTLFGIFSSEADLGVIAELAYDERGSRATTSFENDIMFGLRLTINDAAGSELLAGIVYDYKDSGRAMTIEANRRLGSGFKATLEAYFFSHLPQEDLLYSFRDDDYISVELAYYF
jgi:hypothetical protein